MISDPYAEPPPIRSEPDRVCARCGKSDGKLERDESPSMYKPDCPLYSHLWRFVCACGSITYSRTERGE